MSSAFRSVALLAVALVLVIGAVVVSYRSSVSVSETSADGLTSERILQEAQSVLALVTDAETGQRGYLLTGEGSYLRPYERAVASLPDAIQRSRRLAQGRPEQARRVEELHVLLDRKMAELQATLVTRRTAGPEAALAIVRTGEGEALMQQIRQLVGAIGDAASQRMAQRRAEAVRISRRTSDLTLAALSVAIILTTVATLMIVASVRARERERAALAEQTERRESTERLAAIVEDSDDAIVGKNLDGVITSWNPAAERIFGYRAGEVIGRPITIIIPPDRVAEEETVLARLRRGERTSNFDTVRRTKDG